MAHENFVFILIVVQFLILSLSFTPKPFLFTILALKLIQRSPLTTLNRTNVAGNLGRTSLCPPPKDLTPLPCNCTTAKSGLASITCNADTQTAVNRSLSQSDLDTIISLLRQVNNLPPGQWLYLQDLYIQSTPLSTFDLTPLVNLAIEHLAVILNPKLVRILPPRNISTMNSTLGSIKVTNLILGANALTDEGFGDTLKYFEPSSLINLNLEGNRIQGSLRDQKLTKNGKICKNTEFLPGLGKLTSLESLGLGENKIRRLGGGQFQRNFNLRSITFYWSRTFKILDNAFLLDFPSSSMADTPLFISFQRMNYSDTFFAHNQINGLVNAARPIQLDLIGNNFDYLSAANFQGFLDARIDNELYLDANPLVCDPRMRWLKEGRSLYETRVHDANCVNDVGHTVFTTDKI